MATSDPIIMPSTTSLTFSYIRYSLMSIPYDCTRTFFPASSDHSRRFLPRPTVLFRKRNVLACMGSGRQSLLYIELSLGFQTTETKQWQTASEPKRELEERSMQVGYGRSSWNQLLNTEQYIADLWLLKCSLKTCIDLPVHALHHLKPVLSK
jgi:hypothetical protein